MHRRLARTVVAAAIAGILSEPFGWVSGAAASAAPPIAAVPRMKRLESQWHDPAPPVGVAEDVPAVELNLAEQYVPPVYIDESLAPSSFQTLPDQSFPLDVEEEPQLPPGARAGIFQKWRFSGTWLPQLSSDSIGISELSTSVVLGFPFLRRDTPLLITPFFRVKYLDRPQSPDLPPRVFDTGVEFRHMRKFNERWAMDVAVTTGAYSDFAQGSSDVFRVSGRGLAVYSSSPATKWILGVVYLNRAGASVVPAAGVMYQPHDGVSWELVFPRPRVAWRLPWSRQLGCDERWAYLAGEFGGGIWSIQRPVSGIQDVVTTRDYRFLLGLERRITGGLTRYVEMGYVFSRELEFRSGTPDFKPDDTLLVRAGVSY